MSPLQSTASNSSRGRHGSVAIIVVVVLVVAGIVGTGYFVFSQKSDDTTNEPLFDTVKRGPYEHFVLEQGEVESSNNVEIRCRVKAGLRGSSSSTTIIDIINEGTQVKEGDWLVTFDDSALQNERLQQQILVNNAKTRVIQSKAALDISQKAKTEYEEGTFKEQEQTIQNEIFVSEQNFRTAEQYLNYSEKLATLNFVTPLQLESDRIAVEKAKNELSLGQRKLKVLREHTYEKMMTQLNSDIDAAKETYKNDEASLTEEDRKLTDIDGQIKLCEVVAPQAGQVVYAHVVSSRGQSEVVIEPGAPVRERQAVIRLPDPQQMQIKAKISETRINLVRPNQPVTIKIDAFGDQPLKGVVTKVNKYAEQGSWFTSTGKEYVTLISISNPPSQIRTGLTAEVKIHIENRNDALQIPVQAVHEHKGHMFCLVKKGTGYETRKVVVHSSNDIVVAIDEKRSDRFTVDEQVVINPREHIGKFKFPDIPEPTAPPETSPSDVNLLPSTQLGTTTDSSRQGGQVGGQQGGGRPTPAAIVDRVFEQCDANKDGKISAEEKSSADSRIADRLAEADSNGDGFVDRAELTAVMVKAFQNRQGGGQPRGSGGPP